MNEAEHAAKAALDAFLVAWNAADIDAIRHTLNYPHITLGPSGQTFVAQKPEEFTTDFARMRRREGWHTSTFDSYEVLAGSPDKVHCQVQFSRYRADGTMYGGGKVLYIVTNHGGHWGMQLRSGMPDQGLQAARG